MYQTKDGKHLDTKTSKWIIKFVFMNKSMLDFIVDDRGISMDTIFIHKVRAIHNSILHHNYGIQMFTSGYVQSQITRKHIEYKDRNIKRRTKIGFKILK